MDVRSVTVGRYEEIRRRLAEGRGIREIARALSCSRDTVREERDGIRQSPDAPKSSADPLWMLQLDWPAIVHDLGLGHPPTFVWEEKTQHLTTYSNFWKQFYRKFPQYRQASVTAREFAPGERAEVDYAGDTLEWAEIKTGDIRKAYVLVSGLGFSHLLFAWGAEDMKSRNWLGSHRRMFSFYGGVPHVTVPDCLKQSVLKCHLYDPDLNPGYAQLAVEFSTTVVPARPGHPRNKAIVEGLVKILMRISALRTAHGTGSGAGCDRNGEGCTNALPLVYKWSHIGNALSSDNDCYGVRKRCDSIAISWLQTEDDCCVICHSRLRLDTV